MNAAEARRRVREHDAEADAKSVADDAPEPNEAQREQLRFILLHPQTTNAAPEGGVAIVSTPDPAQKIDARDVR